MIKSLSIITFLLISSFSFSQKEIKPCGQLPQVNPTVKPICENNIQNILSTGLPSIFKEKAKYESTFKLLIDCNGRIDMVIYKNGNLDTAQQKHFLGLINKLKDWKAGQVNEVDVTTTVYFTIDIDNRKLVYKQY
jgi:hypothetical protein